MTAVVAMHMADALVSAKVGITMLVLSAGLVVYAARKISANYESFNPALAGTAGAFVFAAQMINFAIPMTGSSGHIGGGILLAALLGASPAFVALAGVLVIQALFFADGGVLALGCNIFNMAFFPCFVAYPLVFLPIKRAVKSARGLWIASIAACVVSLQFGAFCVVLETLCSQITELSFGAFLAFMQPVHLAIGIAEGVATALVLQALRRAEVPRADESGAFVPNAKKSVAYLAFAALVTGGFLSVLASEKPDGLEWSIAKTAGENGVQTRQSDAHKLGAEIAENTSVFADYSFAGNSDAGGKSASGVAGGAITAAFLLCAAGALKFVSKGNGR